VEPCSDRTLLILADPAFFFVTLQEQQKTHAEELEKGEFSRPLE
jgi:hypothetical protein